MKKTYLDSENWRTDWEKRFTNYNRLQLVKATLCLAVLGCIAYLLASLIAGNWLPLW